MVAREIGFVLPMFAVSVAREVITAAAGQAQNVFWMEHANSKKSEGFYFS